MNALKFINSKSVAKYLEEIHYEFNALEAAFLVWQSDNATMTEKFAAWEEIIAEMPDMAVKQRRYGWETDEPSLHAFLRRYVDFVKGIIHDFYEANDEIYSFDILYDGDEQWANYDGIYTSFELCQSAIDDKNEDDIKLYSVIKRKLNGGSAVKLTFNEFGEIVDLCAYPPNDDESPWLLDYFDGLWFKFPTPFKKGDIVYQRMKAAHAEKKKEPFVLTDMCTWVEKELRENGCTDEDKIARAERIVKMFEKDGDTSDMAVYGYWTDNSGGMYWNHTLSRSYLNLEYYEDELSPDKKFLKALSHYEKGEIELDLLLDTYLVTIAELRKDEVNPCNRYCEEQLKLVGLK